MLTNLRRIRYPALLAALGFGLLATGCTHDLGQRWARIKVEQVTLPVVYRKQGVIIAIDGHEFGSRYTSVRVPPGYHEVHAVFIECALPSLVITCFEGALEEVVPFNAEAGETYILKRARDSAWVEPQERGLERARVPALRR